MNKFLKGILSALLLTVVLPALAGEKPFYDSKSWIVNVAGDAKFLQDAGFASKIYPVSLSVPRDLTTLTPTTANCERIASDLTREGFGKRFIDALTSNGNSDEILKKLTLANVQRQDVEFGAETSRVDAGQDLSDFLAEDYEPILTHNYIVLTHTAQVGANKDGNPIYTTSYAIFRVIVTKEQAFDIVSSIGDRSRWNQLNDFPVEFCYAGVWDEDDTEKQIAEHVPDLAVRGVLLRRHPARVSIGENAGIKKGDLISIYSQRADKNGNQYSKRISRGMVCGVWENESQINFVAGTAGNRKNGDVAVRTPMSKFRFGVMATWMPHVWGGKIVMDNYSGFTRSGIVHHTLVDLGFSMTDHPGDKYIVVDRTKEYKAPMFANLNVGYGIGKTFLGYLDVMLYAQVGYEAGFMVSLDNLLDDNDTASSESMPFSSAIRVPIGLRLGFNLSYPVKLVLEGGYAFNFGFGEDHKIIEQACKYQDAKRKGLFLGLGLIF